MKSELILLKDFEKNIEPIKKISKQIEINFIIKELKEGYRNYKVGEEIKFIFNDGIFGSYEMEGIILDILVEKEENFGFLLIPKKYDEFFPSMNYLLKDFGVENLNVPKDGCFFARHIKENRFSLETEIKRLNNIVEITVPKLFSIPKQTIEKILVLCKVFNKKELYLTRIIEGLE